MKELQWIYEFSSGALGLASAYAWSSVEYDYGYAAVYDLVNGKEPYTCSDCPIGKAKNRSTNYGVDIKIRAVRAF